MRRLKFWRFVESRPLPQTGYVSQRIPHGFSKARGGFTPLPSEPDLRLQEWMNPPVDAYASISGMISFKE